MPVGKFRNSRENESTLYKILVLFLQKDGSASLEETLDAGNKISNVLTPTDDKEVATKK